MHIRKKYLDKEYTVKHRLFHLPLIPGPPRGNLYFGLSSMNNLYKIKSQCLLSDSVLTVPNGSALK